MQSIKAEPVTAVTELFYPYQQINPDNELFGYSVEVVEQLSSLTGDTPRYQLLPWAVAYQTALDVPDTMIFSIGRTSEREPLFAWVGSIATESLYFWAMSQSQIIASDDLMDFQAYRIAVVKEATTHQLLRKNGFNALYVMGGSDSNVSESNRINMLIKGRADIIIAAETAILPALKELNLPVSFLNKVHRAKELDSELSIAFNKQTRPELLQRYKEALIEIERNGSLEGIKKRWNIH